MKPTEKLTEHFERQLYHTDYLDFLREAADAKREAEDEGYSNFSIDLECNGTYAEDGYHICLKATKLESDVSFDIRVQEYEIASARARLAWSKRKAK